MLLEKYSDSAVFVDAHNSVHEDEEIDTLSFGDKKIAALITAIELAKKKLDREKQSQFKVSLVSSEKNFIAYGVKGISLMAFEISGQKTAIAILDTNNLVPGFREQTIKKLKALGFGIVEIVTTDTHLGDFIMKMYGQTGKLGAEVLESEIMALAERAAKSTEKAKASYLHSEIETKVFGEKTFYQLIATAHSLIPFAKFLGVSLFIAFLFAAYVVLQIQIA